MESIKIQDYALINVKEVEEWIKYIERFPLYPEDKESLNKLKQSLIPAEKLASVAFDAGGIFCYNVNIDNNYEGDKQEFLNSNIEL